MAIPRAFGSLSLALALVLFVAPLCSMASCILPPGQRLQPGQSLTSGSDSLTMGADCDLVLYSDSNKVWESGTTYRDRNCYASVDSNGILHIYRPSGAVLWSVGENGPDGDYALALLEGPKLVIYGISSVSALTESNPTKLGADLPAANFKAEKEANVLRISMVVNE